MLPVKVSRSNKATTHCSAEQKYLNNFSCNSENPQNMIKSIRHCENLDEKEMVVKRAKGLNICRGGGWKREVGRRVSHEIKEKKKEKMWKTVSIPKTANLGTFWLWVNFSVAHLILPTFIFFCRRWLGMEFCAVSLLSVLTLKYFPAFSSICPCLLWSISQRAVFPLFNWVPLVNSLRCITKTKKKGGICIFSWKSWETRSLQ